MLNDHGTSPVSPRLAALADPLPRKRAGAIHPDDHVDNIVQAAPETPSSASASASPRLPSLSPRGRPATTHSGHHAVPLLPGGSPRVLLYGSAAHDAWRMHTSKERDKHAIQTTKSYYDTRKPTNAEIYAHIIIDNPKRAYQQKLKREAVDLDTRLLVQRVKDSKSGYRNEIDPWGARRERLKELDRVKAREALAKENARLAKQLQQRGGSAVVNHKADHDLQLARTAKYPVHMGHAINYEAEAQAHGRSWDNSMTNVALRSSP